MNFKVYRDAGPAPSMVAVLIPADGRDTTAEAEAWFGKAEFLGDSDGIDFAELPGRSGWKSAFLY